MTVVVVFAAMLALGAVRLGRSEADRARAQTAADASALAAVLGGPSAAVQLAEQNGGRLVALSWIGSDVLATAQVGASRATARARGVARQRDGVLVTGSIALPLPLTSVPANAWGRPHHDYPALDVPLPVGTPVAALAGGRVKWITDQRCGTGVSVDVNADVRYVYCHGSSRIAADGTTVVAGQALLRSGSSGHSTGPHLHIGIFVGGRSVCPQPLLVAVAARRSLPTWRSLPQAGCTY